MWNKFSRLAGGAPVTKNWQLVVENGMPPQDIMDNTLPKGRTPTVQYNNDHPMLALDPSISTRVRSSTNSIQLRLVFTFTFEKDPDPEMDPDLGVDPDPSNSDSFGQGWGGSAIKYRQILPIMIYFQDWRSPSKGSAV